MKQADTEVLIKHLREVHDDGATLEQWGADVDYFVNDIMGLVHATYEVGFAEAQVQAIEAVGKLGSEDVK